jgi:hypothetical protein
MDGSIFLSNHTSIQASPPLRARNAHAMYMPGTGDLDGKWRQHAINDAAISSAGDSMRQVGGGRETDGSSPVG